MIKNGCIETRFNTVIFLKMLKTYDYSCSSASAVVVSGTALD